MLPVAVGGSEVPQQGVSLPGLHLSHDVVLAERIAFVGDNGLDQLTRQPAQQSNIRIEPCREVRALPIIAVCSVTMKFSGE